MRRVFGNIIILLVFYGCHSGKADPHKSTTVTSSKTGKSGTLSQMPIKSLSSLKHAKNLKFGVYIYRKTIEHYRNRQKELVKTCQTLGITEVYLSFSNKSFTAATDSNYTRDLSKQIKIFHQHKIMVYALTLDNPLLIFDSNKAAKIVGNVLKFNQSVPADSRFDGISADLEPHMLKQKNPRYRGKTSRYWNRDHYGKNKDNEFLLQQTLKLIHKIAAEKTSLTLSQAVVYAFFSHYSRGELPSGKPGNFLKAGCDFILLMIYQNRIDKIISKAGKFFNAAASSLPDKSVMITVKTSINTHGGEGSRTSFAGSNWTTFTADLQKLCDQLKDHKALRGIAFFEFNGLEQLRQKKQ